MPRCAACNREAPCVSVEGLHCAGWTVGGPFNAMGWKCPSCRGNELAKQMNEPFKDVDLARMYPQQEVFDHHVLLAFVNDDDAEFFREWWGDIGSAAFNEWFKNREVAEQ